MKKSKKHLDEQQLRSLVIGIIDEQVVEQHFDHLNDCQGCQQKLAELKLLKKIANVEKIEHGQHIDDIHIAAYVDGKLSQAERKIVERHLITCGDCWDEFLRFESFREAEASSLLVEPSRKIKSAAENIISESETKNWRDVADSFFSFARFRPPDGFLVKATGLAFILVIILGISLSLIEKRSMPQVFLRNVQPQLKEKVVLFSPKNGTEIHDKTITFSWQPITLATQYHFILMNGIGDRIFEAFTDKSFIRVNATVLPTKNETYFWYIVGISESGEEFKSDLSYFVFVEQN